MNGTLSKNKKELHHSLKQIDEDQKLTSAVKAHEMEPSVETRHHNHQGGHEMEFNDRNRKNENPDYHHLTSYWLTPLGKKKTEKDQSKEKESSPKRTREYQGLTSSGKPKQKQTISYSNKQALEGI